MSTPFVVITRPGPVAAPYTYALAAGESFEPETVTATFDCTGAAGACLPCLSVYSENGVLLGRYPAAQVAAGDTAEVTWAPFLGAAAAAAGGGPEWFFADRQTNYTMLAATSDTVQFTRFQTSDPTLFALAPDGVRPDRKVSVARAGVVYHSVFLNPAVVASYALGVLCNEDNGTQLGIAQGNPMNTLNTETLPGASHGNPGMVRMSVPTSTPWAVYPTYDNFDGVNHTLATISYGGVWWPQSTLFV